MAVKRVLVLRNAVTGAASFSNKGLDIAIEALKEANPGLVVVDRDLTKQHVPMLNEETAEAIRAGKTETPAQKAADALANELIAELRSVDLVLAGLPRYNFGVPATFKAYIDYIARPGVTFKYGANGPEGLLPNVPVWAVTSAGGVYGEDFYTKWLQSVLPFIGLKTVRLFPIEGVGMGKADSAMAQFADAVAAGIKAL